jgi:hypothetical protein
MNCFLAGVVLAAMTFPVIAERQTTIDGRVIRVQFPNEDVTLYYVEALACFTVKLESDTASVEARRMYIGDGEVAVELTAHATDGIFLQKRNLMQGDKFKRGSKIKVDPGYKQAVNLSPGDVYVVLPGVTFQVPDR